MKRFLRLLPLLLIAALTLSCFCMADEESPYRKDIYRINDFTDQLTEEQQNTLDDLIVEQMNALKLDLPIVLRNDYGDDTLPQYGEWVFPHNEFGYGENKEGLLLLVDLTKKDVAVLAFGPTASQLYPETDRALLAQHFASSCLENDCLTAIQAYLTDVNTYYAIDADETALAETPAETAAEPEPLPDWYPADVSSFRDFHTSDSTPRVVDNADMFTDAEEAAFTEKLTEMRKRLGADFVLFTDTSTHGFRRGLYCADFYTFNGYGVGDDFNGMILFICMEPGNRGWWEAGTGACEKLFSEENVNKLDDRLEPFMRDGEYARGVDSFFSDIDALFTKGYVPLSTGSMLIRALVSAVISLIVILIVRGILRGKMKVVRQGTEADQYLVRDTFKLRSSHDYFLRTVTTRQKIERSSGGGGSSYSGGYSSSSGRSFSGGGRSF